ncbi:MAG: hypothetical protein HWN68_05295 [Desulfobacterales bacterium]|nr:hypothetical protein [Desulfobacterales bacterium]
MKPILSATYFPFTFIAPELVEAVSFCFNRIVLYRPVGSTPVGGLKPWIAQGFLDIRAPFDDVIDKTALAAELQNRRTWAFLNQDADLAYLKVAGDQIAPADPLTPKIVSQIKGTDPKLRARDENRDLSVQLFLHLSQEFDRHLWEMRGHLNRFKLQQQALETFLRTDKTEEPEHRIPGDPFAKAEEDPGDYLTEKRMAAWSHIFRKDPAESSLLFTDSPSAHAYLLDTAEKKIELFGLRIPYAQAQTERPPWQDRLDDLFGAALNTPWSGQLQERIQKAGRQIESMVDQWEKSTTKPLHNIASFRWHLALHQATCSLLDQRLGMHGGGKAKQSAKNTLVGLVEHRPR